MIEADFYHSQFTHKYTQRRSQKMFTSETFHSFFIKREFSSWKMAFARGKRLFSISTVTYQLKANQVPDIQVCNNRHRHLMKWKTEGRCKHQSESNYRSSIDCSITLHHRMLYTGVPFYCLKMEKWIFSIRQIAENL